MATTWRHLHKIRLCENYKHSYKDCAFAHTLAELRAPDDTDGLWDKVWERNQKGVDRWYGQVLSPTQRKTIKDYFYWLAGAVGWRHLATVLSRASVLSVP